MMVAVLDDQSKVGKNMQDNSGLHIYLYRSLSSLNQI
jgi:hypothetical protein